MPRDASASSRETRETPPWRTMYEIDVADRHLILLALSCLAIDRPGHSQALERIAGSLDGGGEFRRFVSSRLRE